MSRPGYVFIIITIIFLAVILFYTYHFVVHVYCIMNNTIVKEESIGSLHSLFINYSFIHSVHKTPEHDILKINKTGIYLMEVWTQSFGAGVPVTPQDVGGGNIVYTDDYVVIKDIDKFIGSSIRVDVKNAFNLIIIVDGYEFDKNWCPGVIIIENKH